MSASRLNEGKLRWSLLPMREVEEVIRVLESGAKKYGDYNWQKGFPAHVCYDSAMRHLVSLGRGELYDKESGCAHAAHVATNMLFELYYMNEGMRDKVRQVDCKDSPYAITEVSLR